MRKVALAAPMIDSDSRMRDAPPEIIDRFLKMRENPKNSVSVGESSNTEELNSNKKNIYRNNYLDPNFFF